MASAAVYISFSSDWRYNGNAITSIVSVIRKPAIFHIGYYSYPLSDHQSTVGSGFGVLVKQIGMGQLKGCAVEAVRGDGFPSNDTVLSGEKVGVSGKHLTFDSVLNKGDCRFDLRFKVAKLSQLPHLCIQFVCTHIVPP